MNTESKWEIKTQTTQSQNSKTWTQKLERKNLNEKTWTQKLEQKNLNTKTWTQNFNTKTWTQTWTQKHELNNSKLKTEQLKIGFADNSELKTQNCALRNNSKLKIQNSKL